VRRELVAVVHSGYWGLYLLLVSLFLIVAHGPRGALGPLAVLALTWPIAVIAVVPNAAAFYASYGPLFSRLARRRFASLFAGGIGVAFAASALGLLLALLFFGARQPAFAKSNELTTLTLSLAIVAGIHSAVALVIRGFEGWYGRAAAPDAAAIDPPLAAAPREFIFVKTEQRLERVRLADILMIEGQRDYRRIHTPDRRIMTLQTFAEFERQIPADVVCRVHKSYMVGVGRIESIERGRIAIHGLSIPISDTYRDRFYAVIGQN
jgi:hypothetical protein